MTPSKWKISLLLTLPLLLGIPLWVTAQRARAQKATIQLMDTLSHRGADGEGAARVDFKQVKELVNRGADVNQRDKQGHAMLYWAVEQLDPKIPQLLLDAGADINIIQPDNRVTPLIHATSQCPPLN